MDASAPITVCTIRRVKPGSEAAFERAWHEFVQRSLVLPGQMGVHSMRPAPGSGSRDYGIVRKFTNREALAAFRTSPEYLEWNLKPERRVAGLKLPGFRSVLSMLLDSAACKCARYTYI